MHDVYITKLSKYLPNKPISNDEMEDYLGKIQELASRAKRIVLNSNKITTRFYALDKNGESTHTNAGMAAEAVTLLCDERFSVSDIEFLACGTSTPDQLLPSHASMIHGLIGGKSIEIASLSGSCCSGIQALKTAFMSVQTGNTTNAVTTASERTSHWIHARNFDKEFEDIAKLDKNPYLAFEKEFLRWMLSDGAGAALLQNKPGDGLNLKIEWIEISSFANVMETCMYAGSDKLPDGSVKGWAEYHPNEWVDKSIFTIKQDVKLLGNTIIKLGIEYLVEVLKKRKLDASTLKYFLPHLSSDFFRSKIKESLELHNVPITDDKWYTNLSDVGNIGSASIFIMLEELFNSKRIQKGDKVLLMIPESARFSYAFVLLTAC